MNITNAKKGMLKPGWLAAIVVLVGVGVFAWTRVGLLDLPSIPADVSLVESGLANLIEMKRLDDALHSTSIDDALSAPAKLVRQGITLVKKNNPQEGLEKMREGIRLEPENLVLSNAYRMTTFRLRREYVAASKSGTSPVPAFPAYLDKEPIAFFEALCKNRPTSETKLSLALAWVDQMLLFPALEIKAPSSVESVKILSAMIEGDDAYYVPALFARGLNHLHRPSRLVWPETDKTPPDAAVRDIARCIAIGRKFSVGSPRLQALLAIALGDSYVKIGKLGRARSWWQIAQNLCHDDTIQQSVRRRYAWQDEEILDRLEEELDRARGQLDDPMTNLQMMWN